MRFGPMIESYLGLGLVGEVGLEVVGEEKSFGTTEERVLCFRSSAVVFFFIITTQREFKRVKPLI